MLCLFANALYKWIVTNTNPILILMPAANKYPCILCILTSNWFFDWHYHCYFPSLQLPLLSSVKTVTTKVMLWLFFKQKNRLVRVKDGRCTLDVC